MNWKFGDDAWDVLVLVGIILAAMGFFAELWGSRLNQSLRASIAEIHERNRRIDESARANALR